MGAVRFVVCGGPDRGRSFAVSESGAVLIGRDDDCGFALSDPSVSRRHCRILADANGLFVEDAGSKWGLTVNGEPTRRAALRPGDLIALGDTEIRVEADSGLRTTIAPSAEPLRDSPPPPKPQAGEPRPARLKSPPPTPTRQPAAQAKPAMKPALKPITDVASLERRTFLRYEVGSIEARSRSGIVFRAMDTKKRRRVALKVYHPDFFTDDRQKLRFLRAMRTMIPIEHPNLVKLFGAGRSQGVCFTAAEFVEGVSAKQLIQRIGIAGMLDWRKTWRIAVDLAAALSFAEDRGVVHRNLQPSSVLVRDADQRAQLGDLMLARAIDDTGGEKITRRGEVVGDVPFLSPEQVLGDLHLDARSDLYGLGATLYALLTGRPPFVGTFSELVEKIRTQPPEPITKTHLAVPAPLEGIVLRLLAKRPEDRYDSAKTLRTDLVRFGRYQGLPEPV